jgi:hypothetical protein
VEKVTVEPIVTVSELDEPFAVRVHKGVGSPGGKELAVTITCTESREYSVPTPSLALSSYV